MTAAAALYKIATIALAIIGVGFLIGFHEFGHFLFCKLFRIKTPSFSIGFGPRIIEKKIGDTVFALSAIPLGGYVEIAGAAEVGQGDQKEAARADEYSFEKKPYYQKMLVIGGGIIFNLMFTYIALTVLFFVGIPPTPLLSPANATTLVEHVKENSPAARAGIQANDSIVNFNATPIKEGDTTLLMELLKENAGKEVTLNIQRGTETMPMVILLGDGKQEPLLGTQFTLKAIAGRPFFEAVKAAMDQTHHWITLTANAFGSMIKQKTTSGLGGPLSIINSTVKSTEHGFATFILMLCFISVSLAVLNVIPLPIFDGGQALFYTLEALTGRSLTGAKIYIHYVSWGLVVLLTIYLTGKDLLQMFLK